MNGSDAAEHTPIVGIGASAGGLEALKALVKTLQPGTGACYVIVQHLAPDQNSIMDQLLQPDCAVLVSQITDGETARPDHVYIVPPGKTLRLTDGRFTLTERGKSGGVVFRPIDIFFTSLAEVKGRDAYCVVLSGTGTDGSEGLKMVKAAGGFALVQESHGARFPGMPDSAVATGVVDAVLPAGKIAGRLQEIMEHRRRLTDDATQAELRAAVEKHLSDVTTLLANVSGNDFSGYKPGTLVRRIERRMALQRVRSVERFIDTLRDDPVQAELLSQEFLIGVTRFFRDTEAFDALRRDVVRPTLARDQANVRVWVPGCSSGEEAYSVAMMFLEEMEAMGERRSLQIFGTDIDMPALVGARNGLFSPASVETLSDAQRDRFFTIEAGQYRAKPMLRECCVFAPHNLVQDPPFSRLDLISCRNLLIYLSGELQASVIPRLHFALRDQGHLFLGPSESIGNDSDLFIVNDKTHRIFEKNCNAQTTYSALNDPVPRSRPAGRQATMPHLQTVPSPGSDAAREAMAEREFLQRFAAPFALISASGEIAYLSERMVDYVQPAHGVPSSNIDAFLRRELRLPVRNALSEAHETGNIVSVEDVIFDDGGSMSFLDITLGPARQDKGLFVLALSRVRSIEQQDVEGALRRRETSDRDLLETENFNLRRQLAAALQEFDSSGQKLKSANEELLSMNEELQSSNEELETSREELQSINEELETVNSELQENNRLLTRANSDLNNLFESTDVAVLFLDRNFCVRNFTPATAKLFGIKSRDIGRPISDLSSKMDYPGLAEDAATVDSTLQGLEREVHVAATNETYLLRIRPYRSTENVIDGYVLAFVDITNRKHYEETLKQNERAMAEQFAELETLYDTTPVGLALIGRRLDYLRINATMAGIDGKDMADYAGRTIHEIMPEVADTVAPIYDAVFDTGKAKLGVEIETPLPETGEEIRHFIGDFYPVSVQGEVYAVGVCMREVTQQTRMMRQLAAHAEHQKTLLGELQHRVKNTLATISAISKLLLKPDDTPAQYQRKLDDRLQALSRTHDLLTDANWKPISLDQIVEAELSPYQANSRLRFSRKGPDIRVSSDRALSLGIAFHELATNAAKHGALSVPDGQVEITTELDGQGDAAALVRIIWTETGGPTIEAPPDVRGFGSIVFEKVVPRDLSAHVETRYDPRGLICSMTFDPGRQQ